MSLELYRWQFDMKEISALFNNYCIRAFKQLHRIVCILYDDLLFL